MLSITPMTSPIPEVNGRDPRFTCLDSGTHVCWPAGEGHLTLVEAIPGVMGADQLISFDDAGLTAPLAGRNCSPTGCGARPVCRRHLESPDEPIRRDRINIPGLDLVSETPARPPERTVTCFTVL